MVDHHIGDRTYLVFSHHLNQLLKFATIAVQSLHGTLLIEVPEIELVVWIIAIRSRIAGLAERRQPQGINSGGRQLWHLLREEVPPLAALILLNRRIPVKRPAS